MIRWLKERYSSSDWSLLSTLDPSRWQPNPGWTTGAPSYLPSIVASRQLELRYNHSTDGDGHEALPASPSTAPRSPTCSTAPIRWRATGSSTAWPASRTSPSRRSATARSRWPGSRSSSSATRTSGRASTRPGLALRHQKAGGFDCSGFVFYVMKMHFGYDSITVNERGAHDMAAVAKPRITRDKLKCGDLIFFGPKGPSSSRQLDLPRRAVPGPRLVHPLHRLERRRDAGVAEQLELLEGGVRLGPPRAHAGGARPRRRPRRRRRRRRLPRRPPGPAAPSPEAPAASPVGRPSRRRPPRPRRRSPDPGRPATAVPVRRRNGGHTVSSVFALHFAAC